MNLHPFAPLQEYDNYIGQHNQPTPDHAYFTIWRSSDV